MLSIVIPSNNNTFLLVDAINSIISDAGWGEECELCISDNSITHETQETIKKIYDLTPRLIYRRSLDAPSLDENVNMSVSMANGVYVWLFGDDDLIVPGFLSILIEYLRRHKPDIVVVNSRSFEKESIIEESRLPLSQSKIYSIDDNDRFLSELGSYLTYIGSIVIKKKIWQSYFKVEKLGTYFSHTHVVCSAKLSHEVHYLSRPGIDMRLHHQTWTARHFEIWNIFFPDIIWGLPIYSEEAKSSIISQYPLKSIRKILSSRAYGNFNLLIFKNALLRAGFSNWRVKVFGLIIALIPECILRLLYIGYIKSLKQRHTHSFSPSLALAQLRKNKK